MNGITVAPAAAIAPIKQAGTPQAQLEGQHTEITPRSFVSQLSQMRAAVGDPRLSPESLAAIQHGTLPPKIRTPEATSPPEHTPPPTSPKTTAEETTSTSENATHSATKDEPIATEAINTTAHPPLTRYPSGKHFQLTLSYTSAPPTFTAPTQQIDITV